MAVFIYHFCVLLVVVFGCWGCVFVLFGLLLLSCLFVCVWMLLLWVAVFICVVFWCGVGCFFLLVFECVFTSNRCGRLFLFVIYMFVSNYYLGYCD